MLLCPMYTNLELPLIMFIYIHLFFQVDINLLTRNILADEPRVTRYAIDWTGQSPVTNTDDYHNTDTADGGVNNTNIVKTEGEVDEEEVDIEIDDEDEEDEDDEEDDDSNDEDIDDHNVGVANHVSCSV